jgi:hypothetical protein
MSGGQPQPPPPGQSCFEPVILSCGICGEKRGTGGYFIRVLLLSLQPLFPPTVPLIIIIIIIIHNPELVNGPNLFNVPIGFILTPINKTKKFCFKFVS